MVKESYSSLWTLVLFFSGFLSKTVQARLEDTSCYAETSFLKFEDSALYQAETGFGMFLYDECTNVTKASNVCMIKRHDDIITHNTTQLNITIDFSKAATTEQIVTYVETCISAGGLFCNATMEAVYSFNFSNDFYYSYDAFPVPSNASYFASKNQPICFAKTCNPGADMKEFFDRWISNWISRMFSVYYYEMVLNLTYANFTCS